MKRSGGVSSTSIGVWTQFEAFSKRPKFEVRKVSIRNPAAEANVTKDFQLPSPLSPRQYFLQLYQTFSPRL